MSIDRISTLLSRKLAGEATASELTELAELLKNFPDQQIPANLLDEYWNVSAEHDSDFLEATYHLHLNRMKAGGYDLATNNTEEALDNNHPSPGKKKYKKLLTACIFATATITLFFVFFNNNKKVFAFEGKESVKSPQSEVSTKNGSRTKIQLPDGTQVWLNGSSKLMYDNEHFNGAVREVSLTGEGYFDVVKNAGRPFIIHTSKMDVRVLGTIFNVRCYPGEKKTETSLIRGSIEVTLKNRKDKIMLRPSEKLIISDEELAGPAKSATPDKTADKVIAKDIIVLRHLTVLPQDSTIVETAWVENRLVFSSETFEEVALKMEKWYGVEIAFADEKLKSEPLTATFKKETLSEALHALQLATRFNFKINNDRITISK
ncbi:FecR family protein [Ferruginibacter paludis]|uniref:FecR family protein n=1 Tax=Ferruginibacter paludis TaxID=1310417 RepID=UPI0025B5CAD2|nr:FecR family protein [Ferruginibacter paludis]MDN3657723.1 FecR family protein [Ferruginibacter paludis]